ncbi:unnamed protein product [Ambrosiozyma monospora]|uniref:Unnamed protein product n=1 Tax=Ambrosiozyma monospora TaxID=43982 RepID=A0ACB5T7B7_AMBMO|nr:unnamed protein product [Ambrosiozyma monospora]
MPSKVTISNQNTDTSPFSANSGSTKHARSKSLLRSKLSSSSSMNSSIEPSLFSVLNPTNMNDDNILTSKSKVNNDLLEYFNTPYRLKPTTFPPFMLDRMAKVYDQDDDDPQKRELLLKQQHKLEQQQKQQRRRSQLQNTTAASSRTNSANLDDRASINDLFVNTFKHEDGVVDWNQFLHTIKGRGQNKRAEYPSSPESEEFEPEQSHSRSQSRSKRHSKTQKYDNIDIPKPTAAKHALMPSTSANQPTTAKTSDRPKDPHDPNHILDSYNLDTEWKGEMRLHNLFNYNNDSDGVPVPGIGSTRTRKTGNQD